MVRADTYVGDYVPADGDHVMVMPDWWGKRLPHAESWATPREYLHFATGRLIEPDEANKHWRIRLDRRDDLTSDTVTLNPALILKPLKPYVPMITVWSDTPMLLLTEEALVDKLGIPDWNYEIGPRGEIYLSSCEAGGQVLWPAVLPDDWKAFSDENGNANRYPLYGVWQQYGHADDAVAHMDEGPESYERAERDAAECNAKIPDHYFYTQHVEVYPLEVKDESSLGS